MSIYRFTNASPVGEVRFRYANDRPPIAHIRAKGELGAEQLLVVRRALESQHLSCVPSHDEKGAFLQVSGFADEGQLVARLLTQGFAYGTPVILPESGDHPTRSFKEWLQDTSLKGCGIGYLIGDVTLLLSGLMSGRSQEVTSGLFYTAGGAVLAKYGNIPTETHLKQVSESLADFLHDQGSQLPEDCGLYSVLKNRNEGTLTEVDRFLTKFPSQTTISIYTLGAFSMLRSGLKHGKPWDTFYGANSTIAGAASILMPEKRHDRMTEHEKHERAEHGPLGRFFDWIQEKPLRMAGYAYILSGLALGKSAYNEYKQNPKQKSYIAKFITAGTYLVGDVLMAISNKDHVNADGKFDCEEQRRIEALAAEAILNQPKDMHEPLSHHVAGFLSTQPEMVGTANDIAKNILKEVAALENNPWACRVQPATDTRVGYVQPSAGAEVRGAV